MQNTLKVCYRFVLPWLAFFGIIACFKYGLFPLVPIQEQPLETLVWRFTVPLLACVMLLSFSRPFSGRYVMHPYNRREYDQHPPMAFLVVVMSMAFSGIPFLSLIALTDDTGWQAMGAIMLYLLGGFALVSLAGWLGRKVINRLFGTDYEASRARYWRKAVEQELASPALANGFQSLHDKVNATLAQPLTSDQLRSLQAMLWRQNDLRREQVRLEHTLCRAHELRAEANKNLNNHQQVLEQVLDDFNAA